MVRGLDVFRAYFAGHASQIVLIGGTAATLAMEGARLKFRATKDLGVVPTAVQTMSRDLARRGRYSTDVTQRCEARLRLDMTGVVAGGQQQLC